MMLRAIKHDVAEFIVTDPFILLGNRITTTAPVSTEVPSNFLSAVIHRSVPRHITAWHVVKEVAEQVYVVLSRS